MTRLILLDRDGVINHDSDDYIKTVDEFIPIEGAIEAMAGLHVAGFKVGVCTNQSAIGRGLLDEPTLAAIHRKLTGLVQTSGGALAAIAHCPHLPDAGCDCRKPKPGMLQRLMRELDAKPEATTFVGDSLRDVEAALAAGCRPVLVRTGNGAATETAARTAGVQEVYDDLPAFGRAEILRQRRLESGQ